MLRNILRGYEIPYMTVAYRNYFVLYFRRSIYWDNDLAKDWDNIEPTKSGTKLAVFLFIKWFKLACFYCLGLLLLKIIKSFMLT